MPSRIAANVSYFFTKSRQGNLTAFCLCALLMC